MAKIATYLYKNNNKKNRGYGKWYGKLKQGRDLTIRDLAEHIASHGSQWTYDVIVGVLGKLEGCIPELLLGGDRVKLEGLGTFELRMQSEGVADALDWNAQQHCKRIYLRFRPALNEWSTMSHESMTANAQLALPTLCYDRKEPVYIIRRGGDDGPRLLPVDTTNGGGDDGEGGGDGDGDGDGDRP